MMGGVAVTSNLSPVVLEWRQRHVYVTIVQSWEKKYCLDELFPAGQGDIAHIMTLNASVFHNYTLFV